MTRASIGPLGVVLAGGPGSRLGGNKPWRTIAGRRLIDIALEALAPHTSEQMVVTGQVAAMADLQCRVLADRWPGQGPLAALATAFLDSTAQQILVLPVDAPLVRPALLEDLASLHPRAWAVAPMGPGGIESLLARYSRKCLTPALRLIQQGERRVRILLQEVQARLLSRQEVAELDPDDLSFLNVNQASDLQKAEQLASELWAN